MLILNNYISFLNFNWWLIITGLIVWFVVIYFTYSYKPKFIILKSFLWLLAIFSLIFILLEPQIEVEEKKLKAVLITKKGEVQRFEKEEASIENNFILSRLNMTSKFEPVVNINQLLHLKKNITALEIVGDGLTIDELKNLPEIPINFTSINNTKPIKAFEIECPETVFSGVSFTVKLMLGNDTTIHFYCENELDTLIVNNNIIEFSKQFATKANQLLRIKLFDKEKKNIDVITIPVKVNQKEAANIFMLNGYPFFDHQHLKEFIGKQQHQLWVKTQTSISKYRYDFINVEKQNVINLDQQFLKQIDLLIIDGAALKNLSKKEYDVINRGRKAGMGILLRMDNEYESAINNWQNLQLGIKRTANSNRDFVAVNKNGTSIEVEIFPFKNNLPSTKLITGEGAGKILSTNNNKLKPFSITNLKNSYLLNLRGDSIIYKWLWKNIIDESIPEKFENTNVWRLKKPFVNIENDYVEVELITNETEPKAYLKTFKEDWFRLSLKQSYINNELYEATFWPQQSGWYFFKTELDTIPQQLYVSAQNENTLFRKNQKERLKHQLMEQHNEMPKIKPTNKLVKVNKPIALFWNWLVFVLSLSIIFIIEKFFK